MCVVVTVALVRARLCSPRSRAVPVRVQTRERQRQDRKKTVFRVRKTNPPQLLLSLEGSSIRQSRDASRSRSVRRRDTNTAKTAQVPQKQCPILLILVSVASSLVSGCLVSAFICCTVHSSVSVQNAPSERLHSKLF